MAEAQHAHCDQAQHARNGKRRHRRWDRRAAAALSRWDECSILVVTLDDISNTAKYDTLAVTLSEDLAENDLQTSYLANLQKRFGDGFVAPSTGEHD